KSERSLVRRDPSLRGERSPAPVWASRKSVGNRFIWPGCRTHPRTPPRAVLDTDLTPAREAGAGRIFTTPRQAAEADLKALARPPRAQPARRPARPDACRLDARGGAGRGPGRGAGQLRRGRHEGLAPARRAGGR